MDNLVLLMLTTYRSHLRTGTSAEADLDQALSNAVNWASTQQLRSDLDSLRNDLLAKGADQVRLLSLFIQDHELHQAVDPQVEIAEQAANAARLALADEAASQVVVIAHALYPKAVTMMLSGGYGNFKLCGCHDEEGSLVKGSMTDGEVTGLNRLLGLIRIEPSNVQIIQENSSFTLTLKKASVAADQERPAAEPADLEEATPPLEDPVHKALGFIPEPGQFNTKIVDQDKYWVNGAGGVNEIADFDVEWANRIIGYLVRRTPMIAEYVEWRETHSGAAVEEMSDMANDVFQEFLRRAPSQMLEETPLMKALRARVASE